MRESRKTRQRRFVKGDFGVIPGQVERARSRMRLFPGSPSYLTITSDKSGVPGKGGGWRRGRKRLSSHRVRNEAPINKMEWLRAFHDWGQGRDKPLWANLGKARIPLRC
jgi:hypothetical protein